MNNCSWNSFGSALTATAYQVTVTESRQALLGLQTIGAPATQVQAVYSKPELPVLVDKHATHCTLFYPIWLAEGSSKAYTAAFIQVRYGFSGYVADDMI